MSCNCENLSAGVTIGCDNNAGGLRELYLTEKCNVTAVVLSSPGDEISGLTMAVGTSFYKFEFTKKSKSNYKETTTTGDNGGDITKQVLTLKLNRREKTKRDILQLMGKAKDLVAIVKDNNGLNWYLGEVNGLNRTTQDGGSGEEKSSDNGYVITFEGEETEEANIVTDAALAAVI